MSGPRPVRVTIERLVLDGVPPAQRAAVVAAFRAELARLLAAGAATPEAGAAVPPGPSSSLLPAAPDAASAGRSAAAGVARAIGSAAR